MRFRTSLDCSRAVAGFMIWLVGLVGVWSGSSLAQRPERVTIAIPTPGMLALPFSVGVQKGFFADEGLDAKVVVMRSGIETKALASNDLDYTATVGSATRAALTGIPIKIVMVTFKDTDHVFVAQPEMKNVKELRGKAIGSFGPGSTPDMEIRIVLKRHGLDPDKDVTMITIGGSNVIFTALKAKSIAAGMLAMPFSQISAKMGFTQLAYLKDYIGIPYVGLAANTKKVKEHSDQIRRTIKASLRAMRFIRDRRGETLKIMEEVMQQKDLDVLKGAYDLSVELFSEDGTASDRSVQTLIDLSKELFKIKREVAVSDITDWRFARQAYGELKK